MDSARHWARCWTVRAASSEQRWFWMFTSNFEL